MKYGQPTVYVLGCKAVGNLTLEPICFQTQVKWRPGQTHLGHISYGFSSPTLSHSTPARVTPVQLLSDGAQKRGKGQEERGVTATRSVQSCSEVPHIVQRDSCCVPVCVCRKQLAA